MTEPAPSCPDQPSEIPKGRRWKKYGHPGNPETSCRLFLEGGAEPIPAAIRKLSGNWINLTVPRRIETGIEVTLGLTNASRQVECEVVLRVRHAQEQPDGTCVVEGAFTRELSNREMLGLL
jgi:hypothetical protein